MAASKKPLWTEAKEEAERRNKQITGNDFGRGDGVFLCLDEGSVFFWRDAFIRRWRGYIFIHTEHHGFHVFDSEDVMFIGDVYRNVKDET